jgi:hypothetical protein
MRVPGLDKDADVLRADGVEILTETFGDLFPNLHGQ